MIVTVEEFEKYVSPCPITGCWWWVGAYSCGYGRLYDVVEKVAKQAHRVAWELYRGVIPDGLNALHRCDNPPCVNPWHLFLGTQAVNIADMYSKGRGVLNKTFLAKHAERRAQTHCKRGHPLEGENILLHGNARVCRACAAIRYAEFKARRAS